MGLNINNIFCIISSILKISNKSATSYLLSLREYLPIALALFLLELYPYFVLETWYLLIYLVSYPFCKAYGRERL